MIKPIKSWNRSIPHIQMLYGKVLAIVIGEVYIASGLCIEGDVTSQTHYHVTVLSCPVDNQLRMAVIQFDLYR